MDLRTLTIQLVADRENQMRNHTNLEWTRDNRTRAEPKSNNGTHSCSVTHTLNEKNASETLFSYMKEERKKSKDKSRIKIKQKQRESKNEGKSQSTRIRTAFSFFFCFVFSIYRQYIRQQILYYDSYINFL